MSTQEKNVSILFLETKKNSSKLKIKCIFKARNKIKSNQKNNSNRNKTKQKNTTN